MKRIFIPLSLLAVVLVVLMLVRQRTESPIPVGVIAWMGSGAIVGSSEFNAADLFLEEHPRSPIRLVVVDDQWEPELSRAATQKALRE